MSVETATKSVGTATKVGAAIKMTESFPPVATSPLVTAPAASPRFESLLIVRLSAMGDIIHTLPAVALLRKAFPHATLGWLIEERWSELLCTPHDPRSGPRSPQRPLVDRVHTVDIAKWRRALFSLDTWQQFAASRRDLRSLKYDSIVDFQGAVRSVLLARQSAAPVVFGDAKPRESAARIFYTEKVSTSGTHVVEQAVELSKALISSATGSTALFDFAPVEFPVDPAAEKKISDLVNKKNEPRDFVILNPGAGWGAKMWPAERYAEVATALAKDGLRSLINYGPGEEALAGAVESRSGGAARKLSCSVSELISLTRRARLFIGGDTGPMHLAAALKIPVVAIFGPTNPARNGPFATRSIVLRSAVSTTDHTRYREPEQGLLEITVGDVVAAARKLLQNQ